MVEFQYIQLSGAKLGYRKFGNGKRDVIFIHGTAMRATQGAYEDLLQLLAGEFTVYAPDIRGHGTSASEIEGWTLSGLADDVAEFASALEIEKPVLVGHSLGAFIALYSATRHSQAFSQLCLLAPGPPDPRQEPIQALQFMIDHGRDRTLLREAFGQMFVRMDETKLEQMLDAIDLVDPRIYVSLAEQNAVTSIDSQLSDIASPALIVCGARDSVISMEAQTDLARKLQLSKLVIFSTEGHMIPVEQPRLVADEIVSFLSSDYE